jgi:hypothetical protein
MVVAELRKRLVIPRWLEQRQEAPHYGVDRPGCVPNVKVDRIELVPQVQFWIIVEATAADSVEHATSVLS